MNLKRKGLALGAVIAAAALVLSACGGGSSNKSSGSSSGFNAAANSVVNVSSKTGGTLNLVATSDCDSWDPARTYYGWCWNMQRLFTRTLVGFSKVNGDKFELAPDLATSMGQHNANYTQWTYTLKKGLKWSDGKAITPMDVKYGVERMFATDVINGGPTSYFLGVIKHPASYKGPYKSGDLSTITTTDDSVTFNLNSSYADFDYLMAMTASAPVPYKTEGGKGYVGATYGKMPMSSGPFKIASYVQNKSITFVRNPYWSQSTDTIRKPKVDKVVLTIDSNSSDADESIKKGTYDAKADTTVEAAFQSTILTQAKYKKNADDPESAFTRYYAVFPSVIPNIDCRKAIFYATNKASLLSAYGGAAAGVIAGSMTPPGIDGYDPSSNMYPSGKDNTGDLKKAKAELAKCGKPDGFTVKVGYSTATDAAKNAFTAFQASLARVGIKATPLPNDGSTYYSTFIGSPANVKNQGIGIAFAGWGADFPTPYGFWNSIANGNAILPTGNTNYVSLNNPTVNSVLDNSLAGKSTTADWEKLDDTVMEQAVYLPILFGKNLYYRSPRLTNVTCNNAQAFGIYDFVNAGVK